MKRYVVGIVTLIAATSTTAFAGPGWGGMRGGQGSAVMSGRFDNLGLSAEQKEKILALHKENDERQDSLRNDLQEMQRLLRDARLSGQNPSAEELKRADSLRGELQKLQNDLQSKIEAILTPEQREKARSGHRGMGRGRGRG